MSVKPTSSRSLIFLILLISGIPAFSQLRIISPYSRFGIGDIAINNNAWNLSMGQLGKIGRAHV